MKKTCVYLFALPALMVGCTRATFPPIVGQDAAPPDGPPDGAATVDVRGCPATPLPCATLGPSGAVCDPVCQTQTGTACNWCNQKCSIAGNANSPVCAGFGTNKNWDPCNIYNQQSHDQYDDCVAGDICVQDSVSSGAHCFPLCRSSTDCEGEACTQRQIGQAATAPSTLVCDPTYHLCSGSVAPYSCCDPIGGAIGCPISQQCYLLSQNDLAGNNYTVCEYTSGTGSYNTICQSSRDCYPGWFCADNKYCRQVCNPKTNAPCVGATSTCKVTGNQFGYCDI